MRLWQTLILAAGAVLTAGCGGNRLGTVPVSLQGAWYTEDARYAGRYFKLQEKTLVFGQGEAGA